MKCVIFDKSDHEVQCEEASTVPASYFYHKWKESACNLQKLLLTSARGSSSTYDDPFKTNTKIVDGAAAH